MSATAVYIRRLDPRLKLGVSLALGPSLWLLDLPWVGVLAAILVCLVLPLAANQPLGGRMVRGLLIFVCCWMVIKAGLDGIAGLALGQVVAGAAALGLRLTALLLLGLFLALSASPRALGLAVSWVVRPIVGAERAWRLALSLALMVHFLPLCLSTVSQVRQTLGCRCPQCGFFARMVIVAQATIRALGQKTWHQTLAVAGRRLDNADAWEPDFSWTVHDTTWTLASASCGVLAVLTHAFSFPL
jgi:biotin transport system permease protein